MNRLEITFLDDDTKVRRESLIMNGPPLSFCRYLWAKSDRRTHEDGTVVWPFSKARCLMQRFDNTIHPLSGSSHRRLDDCRLTIGNHAESATLQPRVDKVGFGFHFERWFTSTRGKLRAPLSASGEWTRVCSSFQTVRLNWRLSIGLDVH